MLTKPDLNDETVSACLHDAYGIDVVTVEFLPLGADINTAVYRVKTTNNADYFFKLRSGDFLEASVSIPAYLADNGFNNVVAPFRTKDGQLSVNFGFYKAILYPYIDGHNGVEVPLSQEHWVAFGATIKKLHSISIPVAITQDIPREQFSSYWRDTVKELLTRIEKEDFKESVVLQVVAFLKSKSSEILSIIERTSQLASILLKANFEYVLCHADIHGWNLLINKKGILSVVDWDTLIFAPKECDLMFIGAGIWDSGCTSTEEESFFYKGYGTTEVNCDAIAYYRYERIIQDIGEYCKYILLSSDKCDDLIQSFVYLQANFLPNGTIANAYKIDNQRDCCIE